MDQQKFGHRRHQQWHFEAVPLWKVADVVYGFLFEFVPATMMLASKLTRELNLQIPGMCRRQQHDLKAVWNVADLDVPM